MLVVEEISHELVCVKGIYNLRECGFTFTCPVTTLCEFTQLVSIIIIFLKIWWEFFFCMCILWNERLLNKNLTPVEHMCTDGKT